MNVSPLGLSALACSVFMAACGDDDPSVAPPMPEMTRFSVSVENVAQSFSFLQSGGFAIPDGASAPGPAAPGSAYSFRFHAAPGHRLSFATMFVQSNDLFYAPGGAGIELYDDEGNARSGDITSYLQLWDAGTEVDQEPGLGADQAPRQSGGDTGAADADNTVRLAQDTFGNLPAVESAIEAILTHLGGGEFMVRIANVGGDSPVMTSSGGTAPIVLAPGVFTVGSGENALFTVGQPDRGLGLEGLAEDGAIDALVANLAAETGLSSPLAPGVFAVHASGEPLFTANAADRGLGLEGLAEDGSAGALGDAVAARADVTASGVFSTPSGAGAPGPLLPGASYTFEFEAMPGDRLSLATMLVQSNDLFYAPGADGLELFNGSMPRSGDITGEFQLWDAGTEVNQAPGIGLYQAPRQSGADTGPAENGLVRLVNDGYQYPGVDQILRITLTPLN